MKNCDCKRIICPDGIWTAEDLVGAHVKIMSMGANNLFSIPNASRTCTIEGISFRVSLDGKAFTIVKLKEYPDLTFTLKDLMIIGIEEHEEGN